MATLSENAAKVMEKVLGHVRTHKPFYGALLFRLKVREAKPHEGIPTMATDGRSMVYNPAFVMERTIQDLVFIVVHEVTHCVLAHPERSRKPRSKDEWQQACDHAVNLTLKRDSNLTLPYDALADVRYDGMLAETIYECLMRDKAAQEQKQQEQKQQEQKQEQGAAEGEGGGEKESDEGGEDGDGEGNSEQPSPADDNEPGEAEEEAEAEAEDGGGEGSGEGEVPQDAGAEAGEAGGAEGSADDAGDSAEASVNAPGTKHGDVVASGSLTEDEEGDQGFGDEPEDEAKAKELSEEWAEAVIAASVVEQGEAPGAMLRGLAAVLNPPRSLDEEVERFMVERTQGVEDWARKNRRYSDIYLPSNSSVGARTMVYIIDTSGSVGDEDVARMEKVVQRASEFLRVRHSIVIYADSQVQAIEEYHDEPPRFERPVGGGGTRFDPALQRVLEIKEQGEDVAGVIYLTDQMGSLLHAEDYVDLGILWVNTDPRYVRPVPVGEVCCM